MGFLTSIRSSLVIISFTAIALILWLSGSFWYAAYVQRLDAAQLLESIETEDLLFDALRGLTRQRSLAHLMLSNHEAAEKSQLQQFKALRSASSSRYETIRLKIDSAMTNTSLRDRLTFVSAEINEIHHQVVSSFNALSAHEELISEQVSISLLDRLKNIKNESFIQYSALIDATQLLRSGIHFLPRYNDVNLGHLQVLRIANWQFSKAFAREVSLMTAVITTGDSLTKSELKEIESLHLKTLAAWKNLEQYTNKRGAAPELTAVIAEINKQFFNEFVKLRGVVLDNEQLLNRNSLTLDQWLAIDTRTTSQLDQLDKLNSDQIRLVTRKVETRAFRNLAIDTAIVLICLLIGVAVIGVLRKIRHLATHDGLTGLTNRICFEGLLEQELATSQLNPVAVLFVDLDGFKEVNDTLGHEIGDQLLKSVAFRMCQCVGNKCLVARYGGDEFSITITGYNDRKSVLDIANKLVKSFSPEFDIEGFNIRIGVSIGISFYPEDAMTCDELKRNADFAMYYAKSQGSNCVCEFDLDIASDYQQRQQLKNDLKQAIDEQQFELVYQPQVGVNAQTVTGVEALIRWQHPQKGCISPDQFISIAEESGQILEIGDWVLDEACRQMAFWHRNGLANMQIAVNVCSMQFMREGFVDYVMKTCLRHALEPSCLELEITESVLVADVQLVIDTCHRLRERDIKVAIDDFGTGYSSLSYLQELPVDTLKIDRAFVSGLDDSTSKSVAKTIVMLAQSCGLETVAEGVETHDQSEVIRELGCDYIQGYFYSKPVSPAELPAQVQSIYGFCTNRSHAA